MKTIVTLTTAALALTLIGTAAAQDRPGRGDRDGPFSDGVLTRAEALDAADRRFDRVDANEDGFVSEVEVEAAEAAARERLAERRSDRDGRGDRGRRGGRDDGQRFDRQDTNDDGFVSREEAREAALARFDAADADGDGEVTRDEMRRRRDRSGRSDRRR